MFCLCLLSDGMCHFKINASLLIFYLGDLSIEVSGILKSPIVIVFLCLSPCISVNIGFIYLGSPMSEKAMAPHSSTLAWKIPWAEEPGRLQSMRSRRVGHD